MFVNNAANKISFKKWFFFQSKFNEYLTCVGKTNNNGDVFHCCVLKVHEKVYDLCFNIRYESTCNKIISCLINRISVLLICLCGFIIWKKNHQSISNKIYILRFISIIQTNIWIIPTFFILLVFAGWIRKKNYSFISTILILIPFNWPALSCQQEFMKTYTFVSTTHTDMDKPNKKLHP